MLPKIEGGCGEELDGFLILERIVTLRSWITIDGKQGFISFFAISSTSNPVY